MVFRACRVSVSVSWLYVLYEYTERGGALCICGDTKSFCGARWDENRREDRKIRPMGSLNLV